MRLHRLAISVALALLASVLPAAAQAAAPSGERELAELTRRFARAAVDGRPDSLLRFFPAHGDFVWVHTRHLRSGRQVARWRFPAEEARRALAGPLSESFGINVEGQPIGRFGHQAMMRDDGPSSPGPLRWRRARGNRFVPVGDPATSAFLVEWRREDDRWVIAAFGDEALGDPLPRWCC